VTYAIVLASVGALYVVSGRTLFGVLVIGAAAVGYAARRRGIGRRAEADPVFSAGVVATAAGVAGVAVTVWVYARGVDEDSEALIAMTSVSVTVLGLLIGLRILHAWRKQERGRHDDAAKEPRTKCP